MKLPEFIKSWLFGGTLASVGIILSFLLGTIFEGIKPAFLSTVLPMIPHESLIALVVLFAFASFLLFLWILYLHRSDRPKDRLRHHVFAPLTGISTCKKTGIRHCTRCILQDNLVVPLGINGPKEDGSWICMRPTCKTLYAERKD